MRMIFFKVVRLNDWCLHPLLYSFMRSWITNTGGEWNSLCHRHRSRSNLFVAVLLDPRVSYRVFMYSFFLIIWEGESFYLTFSDVMMTLSVIITFSFYGGFLLLSIVLSLLLDGSPDFWLWIDWWCYCGRNILVVIIQAEVVIHSVRSSCMPFMCFSVWIRDLCLLLSEVSSRCIDRLRSVISGASCLGSQDLVIFITY